MEGLEVLIFYLELLNTLSIILDLRTEDGRENT